MKAKVMMTAALIFGLFSSSYAADNIKDMFSEGYGSATIKLMDYSKDFSETTKTNHDTALGGFFGYHTGSLDGISFGITFATSNDIGSSDHDGVYGLVKKATDGSHTSFTRLQESYIQGDWFNTTIKYGGQQIHTPMMSELDLRVVPYSYKGLTVVNHSIDNVTLSGYYLDGFMSWSDLDYGSLSHRVAVISGNSNASTIDAKPVYALGAEYNVPVQDAKAYMQGWYYNMPDFFYIGWLGANVSKNIGSVTVYANPQYIYQKSQGDALNGELDTDQYGGDCGIKFAGFTLGAYYGKTGNDDIVDPWGAKKAVHMTVLNSTRAHEAVYAGKLGYDFGHIGVKGLTSQFGYAYFDAPSTGSKAASDISETDFDVKYAFAGSLDGLSARARYSIVNYFTGEDYNDARFELIYNFKFGTK